MQEIDTVQLVVGGAVIDVPRAAGLDLLARDRRLVEEGVHEPAEVRLPTEPPTVLHLLLGSGSLALIDVADGEAQHRVLDAERSTQASVASEMSVDFDAYL